MTRLETIEKAVSELTAEERAELRAWLDEFEAQIWDKQIERDVNAGKLDELAREAMEDYKAGRVTEL